MVLAGIECSVVEISVFDSFPQPAGGEECKERIIGGAECFMTLYPPQIIWFNLMVTDKGIYSLVKANYLLAE